eukprot:6188171-Pleurochrysis_carterae.AAC.1
MPGRAVGLSHAPRCCESTAGVQGESEGCEHGEGRCVRAPKRLLLCVTPTRVHKARGVWEEGYEAVASRRGRLAAPRVGGVASLSGRTCGP